MKERRTNATMIRGFFQDYDTDPFTRYDYKVCTTRLIYYLQYETHEDVW